MLTLRRSNARIEPSLENFMTEEKLESVIDEVTEQLEAGNIYRDSFSKTFEDEFLISGKTVKQWSSELKISTSGDMCPADVQAASEQLIIRLQTVSIHLALARAKIAALTAGRDAVYNKNYDNIVGQYKNGDNRLPASNTLKALTENRIRDVDLALKQLQIEEKFWKQMADMLSELRKTLETISRTQYIEKMISTDLRNPMVVRRPHTTHEDFTRTVEEDDAINQ